MAWVPVRQRQTWWHIASVVEKAFSIACTHMTMGRREWHSGWRRAGASADEEPSRCRRRRGAARAFAALPADVYNDGMGLLAAVLDTSFWSAAVHVGVDAYLPLFFDRPLLAPTAVLTEIERVHQAPSPRLREEQQRFRLWVEDGRVQILDPDVPHARLGAGEAAALGLARQHPRVALLVNESAGYVEARRMGVIAITVPEVVVRLARSGMVGRARGEAMLDVLEDVTSSAIIARARQSLVAGGDGT